MFQLHIIVDGYLDPINDGQYTSYAIAKDRADDIIKNGFTLSHDKNNVSVISPYAVKHCHIEKVE